MTRNTALAHERVEIQRRGGDQCLAFAGLHLGDLALVKHHAADELDVVVAHAVDAATGLARTVAKASGIRLSSASPRSSRS